MKIKIRAVLIFTAGLLVVPVLSYSMNVSFYLGKVKLVHAGKNVKMKVGQSVGEGDVIKTGRGAIVELKYSDNSKVSIKSNSVVKIGSKFVKGSEGVSIVSGQISGKFVKLKKGRHKLYTPTTVAGVRGTKFKIAVSKGGDTKIDLSQGRLAIDNNKGSVDLKPGYSIEAKVSERPNRSRTRGSINTWEKKQNSHVSKNIDDQAARYEKQISSWEEASENSQESLENLEDNVRKMKSEDDLKKSGETIAKEEDKIENNMMMNEASNMNMRNLSEDYEGKDISDKFKKIADKSDDVREQQQKNYEAMQKIKADYKEAYDKIMKRYKEDKAKIFNDLDRFKKNMFKKNEE